MRAGSDKSSADAGPTGVKYDLSEIDALVRKWILDSLKEHGIAFQLNTHVLEIDKGYEPRVDELIADCELRGRVLEEESKKARRALDGDVGSETCETCGASPAAEIVLRREEGLVIATKSFQVQYVLCESCAAVAVTEFQTRAVKKGWLSLDGILMNPVFVAMNEVNRRKHKKRLREQ